jgi:hypothetical protein
MEILALVVEPAEILPMATRTLADIRNTRSIRTVFRDGRSQPSATR